MFCDFRKINVSWGSVQVYNSTVLNYGREDASGSRQLLLVWIVHMTFVSTAQNISLTIPAPRIVLYCFHFECTEQFMYLKLSCMDKNLRLIYKLHIINYINVFLNTSI